MQRCREFEAVYAELKRHEEAIGCYKEALRLDPKYVYAHNNLRNLYQELGRDEGFEGLGMD